MPNRFIDYGFGSTCDATVGGSVAPPVATPVLAQGDYRARGIQASDSGNYITSIFVDARQNFPVEYARQAAGLYAFMLLICPNQLTSDVRLQTADDLRRVADTILYSMAHDNTLVFPVTPSQPYYIPPKKWFYAVAGPGITPAGVFQASIYDIAVYGYIAPEKHESYTLR